MDTRQQLREFLASRRARITPQQAGLPACSAHRRVPGLRREEVATLAGVSVEHYTRLELGNAGGVSESVLEALARTLQLDDAERAHLYDLVRGARTPARSRRRTAPNQVRPAVQRLIDAMRDVPAFVQNGRLDVLATNTLGRALHADLFDEGDPRGGTARVANHARCTFLDPRAGDLYPDWDRAAGDTVAQLRAEAGRHPDDPGLIELVGELTTRSEQFSTLWATHDVRWHTSGTKRFHHRVVGDLTLAYEGMELAADPGQILITFTAEPGSPSRQALQFLASWSAAPQHAAAHDQEVERALPERLDDGRST